MEGYLRHYSHRKSRSSWLAITTCVSCKVGPYLLSVCFKYGMRWSQDSGECSEATFRSIEYARIDLSYTESCKSCYALYTTVTGSSAIFQSQSGHHANT